MNELMSAILWDLVSIGGKECIMIDEKIIVNKFPEKYADDANYEIKTLVELGYLVRGIPSDNEIQKNPIICLVGINPEKYEDVKKMVNPDLLNDEDNYSGDMFKDQLKKDIEKRKAELKKKIL